MKHFPVFLRTALLACLPGVFSLTPASAQPFIPTDGNGEAPSQAWTYLPNEGQVFDLDGNYRSDVLFHSVGTFPTLYMMEENRIAICIPVPDLPSHANDSIYRFDMSFTGPDVRRPTP
jgi:hypothetical protein